VPRRRPGYLGAVHIAQLLVAELALVAVIGSIILGPLFAAGAVIVGAVLLVATFARRGGRWWMERRMMAWRYRRRLRQVAGTGPGDDPRLTDLRRLAPGLVVENVRVAGGGLVGVARDDAGWFAVASITSDVNMRDDPAALPLDLLATALAEAEQPGAVLQVVVQAVPAPGTDSATPSPAGDSYRQLLASFGPTPVPADQSTWIAVRLDARALAEALGDRSADLGTAPAVVAALIRRVTKSLRPLGITPRLLDADGILAALVYACDLERPPIDSPVGSPTAQANEDWSAWRSSRFAHRCFWIREWPSIDSTAALLESVFAVPAAMTSVSIILAPDYGDPAVDLKALVQIAAPPEQLDEACRTVVRGVRQAKADLFRLDGEQAPAVYASAPTGGGAR
jgi:type VII secretion protein EccE